MNTINNHNINEVIQVTKVKETSTRDADKQNINSGAYEIHLSSRNPLKRNPLPVPVTYSRNLSLSSEVIRLTVQDRIDSAETSALNSSVGSETALRVLKTANKLPERVLSLLV